MLVIIRIYQQKGTILLNCGLHCNLTSFNNVPSGSGLGWLEMAGNGWTLLEIAGMAKNGWKWLEWLEMAGNG